MRMRNPNVIARTAWLVTIVSRRHVSPWWWPAGAFLFLAATSVSAQQPGDTVRVSGERVGVVVEADSAGLLLSSGYAPYSEMQSLEVWAGTSHQAGRGFMYGAIAGGTLGGVLSGTLLCTSLGCHGFRDHAFSVMVGAVPLGLTAGVIGALAGFGVKSDIWQVVLIPRGLSLRLAVGGRAPR